MPTITIPSNHITSSTSMYTSPYLSRRYFSNHDPESATSSFLTCQLLIIPFIHSDRWWIIIRIIIIVIIRIIVKASILTIIKSSPQTLTHMTCSDNNINSNNTILSKVHAPRHYLHSPIIPSLAMVRPHTIHHRFTQSLTHTTTPLINSHSTT